MNPNLLKIKMVCILLLAGCATSSSEETDPVIVPTATMGQESIPAKTVTPTLEPTQTPVPTLAPIGEVQPIPEGYVYLGDKTALALGFNMNAGGSIGSLLMNDRDLIDDTDYGRYFQLSFYDGNDRYGQQGADPYGNWGWNPVQAGSKAGGGSVVGAKTLEYRRADGAIYVKALGKEWGEIDQDSDVIFETWAWQRDGYFEVYTRATHIGTDTHAFYTQEFPAAYFATSLTHEFGFFGFEPFTVAPIEELHQVAREGEIAGQGSCQPVYPTEHWAAFGDSKGFALILAVPPQKFLQSNWALCLLFDIPPVGYISPSAFSDNPPEAVREIIYYLIPGPIETARAMVYDLIPHTTWTFDLNSTEGWESNSELMNISNGVITTYLSPTDWMTSNPDLHVFGLISPTVSIHARGHDAETDICLYFITTDDPNWDSEKSGCLSVAAGDFQSHEFNLKNNPSWNDGVITQLRLSASSPTWVDIDSLRVNTKGFAWEFEVPGDEEGWVALNHLDALEVRDGYLFTYSKGDDPYMSSPGGLSVDAGEMQTIEIRMKVSAGEIADLFFITDIRKVYDPEKMLSFPINSDGQFHTYTLDMSTIDQWQGTITQIRLDPTITTATIEIDYIRILGKPKK
jgi:hypothetical protein